MKALKYLNKYFWKYKWQLLLGILFIVIVNIFAVLSPFLIKAGVDVLEKANHVYFSPLSKALEENPNLDKDAFFADAHLDIPPSLEYFGHWIGVNFQDAQSIQGYDAFLKLLLSIGGTLALFYIVIYTVKGLFLFLQRQTIIVMSRYIEFDLKSEIFDHYQKLSLAFYKRNNTGDLMNRISEDVSKVRMYLGPSIMYTINLVVLVIMVIVAMLLIDIELTLYALLPLPFMSVSIYLVSNRINKKSDKVQAQQSIISTLVQENISGIRVLKAYRREKDSGDQFAAASDLYKMNSLSLVKTEALFMPIIVLLVGLSTILTIYIGGTKVMAGVLSLGDIFLFVFYVNMLTWPFASVGWVTSLVQKAEASQNRINQFLNIQPEIRTPEEGVSKLKGAIRFNQVSFTYPDSGIEALRNISFEVKEGETLAIVGRTGSGKSTIANLLCRMYDPDHGEITIGDTSLKKANLSALRSSIGYVPQEIFLFSDTVSHNISFGLDSADNSEVYQAAVEAGIHENILNFPKGYDTILGERGVNLSGGQKQRISIARAIIKRPDILIFDDCLSAVDTETEERILASLKDIMENRTSIIISHRISSIRNADKIIVLENGKIIEEGSHQDLIALGGVYAELDKKQKLDDQTS